MRKGEVVKLRWDHVDLDKGVICLEQGMAKDKEEREIPICPELHKILSSIQRSEKSDYVFIWRDGKPTNDIRTSLKRACEAVGITYGRFAKDGFVFHDIRRTFITNITDAEVPQAVRMEITGHSTVEMDSRYNVVDLKRKQAAILKLESHVKKINSQSK
jgi:integrase